MTQCSGSWYEFSPVPSRSVFLAVQWWEGSLSPSTHPYPQTPLLFSSLQTIAQEWKFGVVTRPLANLAQSPSLSGFSGLTENSGSFSLRGGLLHCRPLSNKLLIRCQWMQTTLLTAPNLLTLFVFSKNQRNFLPCLGKFFFGKTQKCQFDIS